MRYLSFSVAVWLMAAGSGLAQSSPFDGLDSRGRSYADPALYAQHKAQWLDRVRALPDNVDVLEGAADFFMIRDRPLAQELLERAQTLEPKDPRWLVKLAQVHRLNANALNDLTEARLSLNALERAYAMAPEKQRHLLTQLPQAALDAEDFVKARTYATRLLDESGPARGNWDYGNAVHQGNLVLGRIAVREGRIAEAIGFLHASGKTPGSPQLNSFGPNMTLARDLLERGEAAAVLAYFELCRVFWKMGDARLDAWIADVGAGRVPNFGANLRY